MQGALTQRTFLLTTVAAVVLLTAASAYGQVKQLLFSSLPARAGETILVSYESPEPSSRKLQAANPSISWSLRGPGSLHGPNPGKAIEYTAPVTTTPLHTMFGCQVGPNDTVFNTPIDSLPADPQSPQKLNGLFTVTTAPLKFESAWGISHADSNTPIRTMRSYYDSKVHAGFPNPVGPALRREGGNNVGIFPYPQKGNSSPDHHVLTVRDTDCSFFETYDDYLDGFTRPCRDGTPNCSTQSAVSYNSGTYAIQGGTDAAGLLLGPLTWHLSDVKKGHITHATRFTENGYFALNSSIWPASATAGGTSTCTPISCLQLGSRVRLRGGFDTAAVCNSGNTAQDEDCNIFLRGLAEFGMILADTGGNNSIQIADDISTDPVALAALSQIQDAHITLTPDNFEVVDESSLEITSESYQICPYNERCAGAVNSFVIPQDQAIITATLPSGEAVSAPIAIQGAGIEVPSSLLIAARTSQYTIPSRVNGSIEKGLQWHLQSGVGTISANGTYRPPASGAEGTSAIAVATSVINPNVVAAVPITILSANPTNGAIQIDTGSLGSTPDSSGNIWLSDPGFDGIDIGRMFTSDYPNWSTNDPQRAIFQSSVASGSDIRLTLAVPNGNYQVHFLFGLLYDGCKNCTSWIGPSYDTYTFGPSLIETQGENQFLFDFGLATNYQYATPADTYAPATVTNGNLDIGVLAYAPDTGANYAPAVGNKITVLNGIEIIPDASMPHWVIDTGQQSSLSPGGSVQLTVVDYFVGTRVANWTILDGPGSISSTGLLQLPSGSYTSGTTISILARDPLDSSINAMTSFQIAPQSGSNSQIVSSLQRTATTTH